MALVELYFLRNQVLQHLTPHGEQGADSFLRHLSLDDLILGRPCLALPILERDSLLRESQVDRDLVHLEEVVHRAVDVRHGGPIGVQHELAICLELVAVLGQGQEELAPPEDVVLRKRGVFLPVIP